MSSGNGNLKQKTYYIPFMCDHAHVLGAALEAFGLQTEVLPPSDDETLNLGLASVLGKECSPCFTSTGDLLRRARQPGFDPARAVMFMPTAEGPCRFGQYNVLQRQVLDDYGLQEVEILSMTTANNYRGFVEDVTAFRALAWDALVLTDLAQKLLHAHRPYELQAGQTEALYQACLQRVIADTRAGGGRRFAETAAWMAQAFGDLPVDRGQPRPVIGVIGEIYIRVNEYTNHDIVREVEAAGGEVVLALMMEWLYYVTWSSARKAVEQGRLKDGLVNKLTELYQRYREHRLVQRVAHLLPLPYETPTRRLMENILPYYEPLLGTEAVLTIGEAIELARHGVSGILNVMPFSCMPGIISAGLAPRLRADLDNIPWLDVTFDARGGTNFRTRLEAFIYQAEQYHRRRAAVR
jgi:predicted nucleotide-binding protein (sugar kinase/HSP70/actin superfamily)